MAVKGNLEELDILAQLEHAMKKKEDAEREYRELKKNLSSTITAEINNLIKSASIEPMALYESCIANMTMSADEALEMSASLILKAGVPDSQAFNILKSHRALVSVSAAGRGEGSKERSARAMVFRYKLEAGEKDLMESGKITEGVHRHDPEFWCPKRKSDKNPEDWYDVPGKFAEFVRTAEESARYKKYIAAKKAA